MRSPLGVVERRHRIWSYDLFRAMSDEIIATYLPESGLRPGDDFRPIFAANTARFGDCIKVHAGDFRAQPVPDHDVAILFLDILWSWSSTAFVAEHYYPRLPPRRSVLIHQDFVYPLLPWLVLSMGMLADDLPFAGHVQHSSPSSTSAAGRGAARSTIRATCRSRARSRSTTISLPAWKAWARAASRSARGSIWRR